MSEINEQNPSEDSFHTIDVTVLTEIATSVYAAKSKNPLVQKANWGEIAAKYVEQKNLPFYSASQLKQLKVRLMNKWNHIK